MYIQTLLLITTFLNLCVCTTIRLEQSEFSPETTSTERASSTNEEINGVPVDEAFGILVALESFITTLSDWESMRVNNLSSFKELCESKTSILDTRFGGVGDKSINDALAVLKSEYIVPVLKTSKLASR